MIEFIQQYLLLYKTVSIKGWGTFKIVPVVAELDFTNRLLHAPYSLLEFNTTETDDTSFLKWIANERKISIEAAIQERNLFVNIFKQSIESTNQFFWQNWGVFNQTEEGVLTFNAAQGNKTLLHAVTADRVIRKGAEHSVRVGEDERTSGEMEVFLHTDVKKKKPLWLLNALLLLSIGIIFALHFATNYNTLWNKYSNSQLIQPKDPPVLYKKH